MELPRLKISSPSSICALDRAVPSPDSASDRASLSFSCSLHTTFSVPTEATLAVASSIAALKATRVCWAVIEDVTPKHTLGHKMRSDRRRR